MMIRWSMTRSAGQVVDDAKKSPGGGMGGWAWVKYATIVVGRSVSRDEKRCDKVVRGRRSTNRSIPLMRPYMRDGGQAGFSTKDC